MSIVMTIDPEVPLWDPALAALLAEECKRTQQTLRTPDLGRIARENGIRFDDLATTILEMWVQGAWHYRDEQGVEQHMSPATHEALSRKERLSETDFATFTGGWSPKD